MSTSLKKEKQPQMQCFNIPTRGRAQVSTQAEARGFEQADLLADGQQSAVPRARARDRHASSLDNREQPKSVPLASRQAREQSMGAEAPTEKSESIHPSLG